MLSLSTVLFAQEADKEIRQGFLDPPDDARPMMRWWWFGPAVVRPELKKELETMRGAGIGGVEIQPVYPLMLDDENRGINNLRYLSQEFLDDLGFANQTARSLGMRVDITLGSGWPYGGPKTTLALAAGHLKIVSRPVVSSTITPPPLAEGDGLVAAFTVDGAAASFDPASVRRLELEAGSIRRSEEPQTALFFIASHTRQTVKRAAYGAEGYVLDHFSGQAIQEHLTDVATPLLNAFGGQPPYAVFSDSLEVYGSDWTSNLPAEFLKRRGYDLIPHLPELVHGGTPAAEAIRHDWGLTLSDLIRENYLAPITEFAEAHHTRFRSQTYGDPAVTLADEAVPSLPEGEGPQWRAFSYTRWASSASHLYQRNITSAETWTWLHSPAFRATPLDMKVEADRMFLLGVNQIVGHGFPYSPPAADEPGWSLYAAAAFNSHNPWFPVMPDITKYLQRVSWVLRQGKPVNDVAILLPEDDAQAAFAPGHVSVTEELRKRIRPEMMATVLDAGYNIDYIDCATIAELGNIPYPILILPPTNRIPLEVYRKIENYAASGGNVIAIEKLPSLAPGFLEQNRSAVVAALSARLFQTSGHNGVFVTSMDELTRVLHRALSPDVEIVGGASNLGFVHRKLPNSDIYFVVNSTNHPVGGEIRFRSTHSTIEAWNPDGAFLLQKAQGNRLPLSLAPYESRLFLLDDHKAKSAEDCARILEPSSTCREQRLADLSTKWMIRFADHQPSRWLPHLTSWSEIPGKNFYSGEVVYSRTFSVSSNALSNFASTLLLDFGDGTPTVDRRPPDAPGIHALLDPPIREAAIIFVNGKRVGSLWHPPYRINISAAVHSGENQIEIHVFNTAINALAGQPPRDYTALRAKYGRRFDPQDMDNLQAIPSGLIGTISLCRFDRSDAAVDEN